MWFGTNAGLIYIYEATIPESDKRDEEPVQAVLSESRVGVMRTDIIWVYKILQVEHHERHLVHCSHQ